MRMTAERIKEINGMSLEQLTLESSEVLGAASNERIWMLGSDDEESQLMHHDNRENLILEYRYIQELIEKKQGGK